jgi:hypothetical protein
MRYTKLFLPLAVVMALGLSGCGKSKSETATPPFTKVTTDPSGAPLAVDISKLQAAFPEDVGINEMATMIGGKDYDGALHTLQAYTKKPKLTPAQKQAVDEVIAALQNLTGGSK